VTRRRAYELQGELRCFPPPVLFQMMALGNLDGLIVMRSPAGTSEVFFQAGKLVFARGPGQKRTLGEELVRRGLLERSACEAAARERDRHPEGPRIGAILVQRGIIRREELEALMRERIKEAICAVVDWREGRFTFEAGVHPDEEDILLDVQLESLLLECMTRLDDARRGTTDAGEVQT
jgi:hypothetical protein